MVKDINVLMILRKVFKIMCRNVLVEKFLEMIEKRDNNKNIKVNMIIIYIKMGVKFLMDNKGENFGFLEKVKNVINKKLISLMLNIIL